ncbi:MAG: hypothetical protein GEV07_14210 [Streptosporangiales bacterium]|nr:hypothetical protein [Streptosporangiales bacterium]
MAERVFLHVGAPKTGTTYLQQMLWGNRSALKNEGILLPATRKAHYQAMGDLRRGVWHDPDAWWTWDRLAAKARAWSGTVVISEEMLGAATPSQAKQAIESLQSAEVHVVVAGRDLGRTIPSSWQQGVRARNLGRYRDYVNALQTGKYPEFWAHQTPLPILRRWSDSLPAAQRHLVTVPPDGADPLLLWQRFAGVIGIPEGLCEQRSSHKNTSLGVVETELLRRVNNALGDSYPLRAPYLKVVHGHLVNPILKRRKGGERFGAPLELADWIRDTAEQMADDVRQYKCDVAGDPADLVPAELREGTAPDEVSEEVLLQTAVETIVGMLKHTDRTTRRMRPAEADMSRRVRRFTVRAKRRLGSAADRLRRFG